ncbi:hypothetical protein AB0H82_02640 [Streptomyces sp. NPDC050732]|uniref:hypothetical protein n=1 Tax=Streptomyces sp. NPDC050732 TaxID=3154632 RepID=UPI00342047F6
MLRSALVATFSAGLVLGSVTALDLGWQSTPTSTTTNAVSAPLPDLGWTIGPKGAEA